MRIRYIISILLLMVFTVINTSGQEQKVTVTTDKEDYWPGECVIITGTGWQNNDSVQLTLTHLDPLPEPFHLHTPWFVIPDAEGNIYYEWLVLDQELGTSFELGALGFAQAHRTSDYAVTYFTDARITNVSVNGSSFCSGQPVIVSYTTSNLGGRFGDNNLFTAQLSDASGGFSSPVTIGTLQSRQSGDINAIIPSGTANGTHYRVRVLSSNPVIISNPNTRDLTINVSPTAPAIVTATPPAICEGASSNLNATSTGNSIRWYTTDIGGPIVGTSKSGANFSVTPANTTTYYAEALNTAGCSSPARTEVTVTVNPIPIITSTTPGSVCGSGTVTLTAASSAGIINWYSNATTGVILATGESFTTPIITVSKTYYVDASSNGCKTTTRTAVRATVNAAPTAPLVGIITQPTCLVSTGGVVLNGLPVTGTWTVTRTPGATTTNGTGTSTIITGIEAGTYTFTVTNASGCISTASANVVINAQSGIPTAPTVGTITQPTCVVSTGSVELNGLPATGTWTLTRTPGGTITSGTGTSTTITGLIAGTFTYTVTNESGCISTASANVAINTQPVEPTAPTVGSITQPTCLVSTGSVVLNDLPATGTWTLTRTPGGTTTNGTGTSTTITGVEAGTYTYAVTNAGGCTSEASSDVIIPVQPAAPTVNITNPAAVCSPLKVNLTAGAITSGSTPDLTFTYWTDADATTTYSTPSAADAGTFYIKGTTSSGCFSIEPVIVTINPLPTANAGSGGNECDLNFRFNAVESIGTGIWTQTAGPGTPTYIPDSNTPDAEVRVSAYGNYTFTWTETSEACSNSSSVNVNFYQQPIAHAGAGGTICGNEFNLGATPGFGTGTWMRVSGPGSATFSPNANTPNAKVVVNAYGTYTLSWTEVNGTCSNSASISITFVQQPSANAGIGGDECDKDFILNAVQGAVAGVWTKVNGPGNAVFSPGVNKADAKVTVSQVGSYDFAWNETNALCTSTDIVRVTFHNLPSISAGADVAVCKGSSIQLNAIGSGSFLWTPANLVNKQNISNPTATPAATSILTVTLTDQWGCKNADQVSVDVREQPVASAGPDQVLEYLFETTLNADALGNKQTGEWTVISGTGEFSDKNDNATLVSKLSLDHNSFKWTITNGVCPPAADTVNIIVHDLIIPTLITPNNDGKNEYFIIKGIETLGKTELIVFNRWGSRVYMNSNYDNKWDGVDDNNEPLPDDTYFFILKPEKNKAMRGYLVIRR